MEKRIERLMDENRDAGNLTERYLLMAREAIEGGDPDMGRACLMALCRSISNYEESIEWNGMTDLWERYRYLVEGFVEPSARVMMTQPKKPSECARPIGEILALSDEELLGELSGHLQELSGNGDALASLNKWERMAWYVDELCMEVNSGGFDAYLSCYGTHFEKAYQALEQMGAVEMTALLDRVRGKFPRSRLPKSCEAIENAVEALEEAGVDFEAEDDAYYGSAEKELLQKLTAFVRENGRRFR